jgi:hypothetical protein
VRAATKSCAKTAFWFNRVAFLSSEWGNCETRVRFCGDDKSNRLGIYESARRGRAPPAEHRTIASNHGQGRMEGSVREQREYEGECGGCLPTLTMRPASIWNERIPQPARPSAVGDPMRRGGESAAAKSEGESQPTAPTRTTIRKLLIQVLSEHNS